MRIQDSKKLQEVVNEPDHLDVTLPRVVAAEVGKILWPRFSFTQGTADGVAVMEQLPDEFRDKILSFFSDNPRGQVYFYDQFHRPVVEVTR